MAHSRTIVLEERQNRAGIFETRFRMHRRGLRVKVRPSSLELVDSL